MTLGRGCVFVLADTDEIGNAIAHEAIGDEAAVSGWILGVEPQHGNLSPAIQCTDKARDG